LICLDAFSMVLENLLIMGPPYCLRLTWIFRVSYFISYVRYRLYFCYS
jgi:hypothetical protein